MNTEKEIKRKLIAAAMDEFYEASFDEATMRSISKRTGFSSATVYKYFDSKHKLAMVLGAQIIERYNGEIELHLKGIEGTRNKVRKIAWYYFHHFQENEKEAWICYVTLAPVYYRELQHQMESFVTAQAEFFERILREGQKAGDIRPDVNIRAARAMFFGSLREFVTRWLYRKRQGDKSALEDYFEPFANLFLSSIEARPDVKINCPYAELNTPTDDRQISVRKANKGPVASRRTRHK
ncbi:MAG: TetR/AcrR family transcriptional regulator [Chloroflexi bacterium]|nr:TetR/AcrR family transcriptional regulator [Chloroflexota bacterium]